MPEGWYRSEGLPGAWYFSGTPVYVGRIPERVEVPQFPLLSNATGRLSDNEAIRTRISEVLPAPKSALERIADEEDPFNV